MVENSTTPTPLDVAAEDFIAHRPYYTRAHLSTILLHIEAIGLPYCTDCHDWHADEDGHSEPPVPAPREEGAAALGNVLAMATWVAAMLLVCWSLVGWFAPEPAAATRPIPGYVFPDQCANIRGTQTVWDLTTSRRYTVVHIRANGERVCRPIHRGQR